MTRRNGEQHNQAKYQLINQPKLDKLQLQLQQVFEVIITRLNTATCKNVKIFYQNSIIVAETKIYVKASSTRQRALRAHRLK